MKWQPIETAPQDNTCIITYGNGLVGTSRYVSKFAAVYGGDTSAGWYSEQLDRRHEPTHWMPLPAPPPTQWRWEVNETEGESVSPPEALQRFMEEHREITADQEETYERLLRENDEYVGACQYQGNTVSYIKSKADNYGRQLLEAHRLSGAAVGVSVLDRIKELVALAGQASPQHTETEVGE